jgi:hypothetical protein
MGIHIDIVTGAVGSPDDEAGAACLLPPAKSIAGNSIDNSIKLKFFITPPENLKI